MKKEPTDRGTVKTSAILIADGRRTAVYRTVEEIPPELRRKLAETTAGSNAATVLIADRRGAQELLRANIRALIEERIAVAPGLRALMRDDVVQVARFLRAHWLGFAVPAAAALALWRLFR
ncbi:MAG: hypothetical protein ABSH46_11080 [Bryobacteraceae bacterium]